jgi:hypothetical protein
MAVDALRAHKKRQAGERLAAGTGWSDQDLVYSTRTGRALDAANVRREFRAICRAAKIGEHWTPRELRHSFVSLMSSSGVPVEEIARIAGHSSSRTQSGHDHRAEGVPVVQEACPVEPGAHDGQRAEHDRHRGQAAVLPLVGSRIAAATWAAAPASALADARRSLSGDVKTALCLPLAGRHEDKGSQNCAQRCCGLPVGTFHGGLLPTCGDQRQCVPPAVGSPTVVTQR